MATRARGSAKSEERFSTVQPSGVPRSAFDRSHSYKTTINSGFLYPIFVDEIVPGDTVNMQPAFFARMSTPLKPFMDGLHLDVQWFFVPLRILWLNFYRFMGEQKSPGDHIDYTIPQMVAPAVTGHLNGSLADYFGMPTDVPDYTHSALYHRAYYQIYDDWYRDENIQDGDAISLTDGPDLASAYELKRRGKRKDFFSGALPFAQKGAAVDLPLGTVAPVVTTGVVPLWDTDNSTDIPFEVPTGTGIQPVGYDIPGGESGVSDIHFGTVTGLQADLTNATAATINDMRQAIAVQHLLEKDARGGTRYVEITMMHFGVQSPDWRHFRPILLGTSSTPVQVSAVAKTSDGEVGEPQGSLAAFATAQTVGRGWVQQFNEHGIVMGICSVRAELTYQQGLQRQFIRRTRDEFYFPAFAGLGERAIESREIYTDGTGDPVAMTGDFSIWGYQPIFEEMRHRTSMITGEFRSNFAQSLDVWHLGLDFASRPVLNDAFIVENPPVSRVLAVQTPEPEFLLDAFFRVKHVRPMPKFGTPGLTRF